MRCTLKQIRALMFKSSGGYSLLELAISMMVLGLVIAPIFVLWGQYRERIALDKTEKNIAFVKQTMQEYKYSYGHYPCPAFEDVGPGDAGYGFDTDCTDTTVAVGACGGGNGAGICVQQSEFAVDSGLDGDPSDIDPADVTVQRVRSGAIPFLTMGIDESYTLDGYGNKFTYVVTEQLAQGPDQFFQKAGGIQIHGADGNSIIEYTDDIGRSVLAQFAIISHGEDLKGGYSRDGTQAQACAGGTLDSENCDFGTTASSILMSAPFSTSGDANQNDDFIAFSEMSQEQDNWEKTNPNPIDIHERIDSGNVKMAINMTTDPEDDVRAQVQGGVRISDDASDGVGKLIVNDDGLVAEGAQEICLDVDNIADCLDVRALSGAADRLLVTEASGEDADPSTPSVYDSPNGGLACPAGMVLVGISQNRAVCKVPSFNCPSSDLFLIGFDNDGNAICEEKKCQPKSVDLCDDGGYVFTLPLTDQGRRVTAYDEGTTPGSGDPFRREAQFRCEEGGEWSVAFNYKGVCSCTAGVEVLPTECPTTSKVSGGYPRGECPGQPAPFTGSGFKEIETTCPMGYRDNPNSVPVQGCECNDFLACDNERCEGNSSQQYERRRQAVCSGGGHVWSGDWEIVESSLANCEVNCDPNLSPQKDACDTGYKGPGRQRSRTKDCVTGDITYGAWEDLTEDGITGCVCDETETYEMLTCTSPNTVSDPDDPYRQPVKFNCSAGKYVPNGPKEGQCIPIASDYIWKFLAGHSPIETNSCPSGAPQPSSSCTTAGEQQECCYTSGGAKYKRQCRCETE